MRTFIVMATALLLASCQSSAEKAAIAQRYAEAGAQKERIAAAIATKKISFAAGVRAMNDIDRADNPDPSPAARETMLYQEAIAEKVDANQISVKEYLYLTEKNSNEVFGKAQSDLRQERLARAAEESASRQPDYSMMYATKLITGR